jgi:hypothetical protein
MAEIKIKFDLTFSRRFVTAVSAAAMMFCAVPELESESVTLSTYYPAPSGVYTNMITTSNTYLARDGGNVGIGTTGPVAKLDVNGTVNVAGTATLRAGVTGAMGIIPNYAAWASYGTGDGGAAIYNDAGAYQGLMLVGNNSGGGLRRVKVWDEFTVNGNSIIAGRDTMNEINSTGVIESRQGCTTPATYTYPTPAGGTVALCPGQYVTLTDGIYVTDTMIPVIPTANTNPQVTVRCCHCPTTGCNL